MNIANISDLSSIAIFIFLQPLLIKFFYTVPTSFTIFCPIHDIGHHVHPQIALDEPKDNWVQRGHFSTEKLPIFSKRMIDLNLSMSRSPLCEIKKMFVPSMFWIIFINSSHPAASSDASKTSSRMRRFVLIEFFFLAIALQVKRRAISILIFSPSEKLS